MRLHHLATRFQPPSQTWVDLLRTRASRQKETVAFRFLGGPDSGPRQLTFGQLDQRARSIAAHLTAMDVCGERILLAFPPGLDFISAFFGCLYAGAIAVPAYPPHPHREDRRLVPIAEDANPALVLSMSRVIDRRTRNTNQNTLSARPWVAVDEIDDNLADTWQAPDISGQSTAFLQYTSGSTAAPKGVIVSHANLLVNAHDLDLGWNHTEHSVLVSWLPLFHDLGLIYGVLQPVYKGFSSVLMPPASFLQRPKSWLEAITKFKATHSAAPNFAYDLCCDKIAPDDRMDLDLRSWTMTLNAAEPIRAATIARFTREFSGCGFSADAMTPGYGLAECSLKATSARAADPPLFLDVDSKALSRGQLVISSQLDHSLTLVGCGASEIDTELAIVDPASNVRCPPDRIGEIWIRGASVAGGYWQRPEESQETFQACTVDGQGPYLRSGDLGFVWHDQLFVTGRIKDVIIIRGLNYYPQDIELSAQQSHTALRPGCCAAFGVEIEGVESLVVVQEIRRMYLRGADTTALIDAIRQAVFRDHDLPLQAIVLVKPANIPKTSSGKIQRAKCRQQYLDGSLSVVGAWSRSDAPELCAGPNAPRTLHRSSDGLNDLGRDVVNDRWQETERAERVRAWLANWLQNKFGGVHGGVRSNLSFADCGFDSVTAVELARDLGGYLRRNLEPTILWSFPTIGQLVEHVVSSEGPGFCSCADDEARTVSSNLQPSRRPSSEPDLSSLSLGELRAILATEVQELRQRRNAR